MRRYTLLLLGHIFFALGLTGFFVPGVPGVVFMLVAAWAYSKSCPHLEEKLLNHQRYGAVLRAWREHRVIPAKAKTYAGITMVFSLAALLALSSSWLMPTVAAFCMTGAYAFIITRPSDGPSKVRAASSESRRA